VVANGNGVGWSIARRPCPVFEHGQKEAAGVGVPRSDFPLSEPCDVCWYLICV
jgi:hypothetical protein